jgi:phage gpG-like protein
MATVSGLSFAPGLMAHRVSIDMSFEPSIGISAKKLDKLGLDIRSFREPLRRSVKQVMAPSIRMNFDVGGRPPWEPLQQNTINRKKGNASILIRTGALRRVAGQLNIWTITNNMALVADLPQSVWYGKVHQAGFGGGATKQVVRVKNIATGLYTEFEESNAEGGSGAIPARPFIVLQPEDVTKIEMVFAEWLDERIAAAGLGGRR